MEQQYKTALERIRDINPFFSKEWQMHNIAVQALQRNEERWEKYDPSDVKQFATEMRKRQMTAIWHEAKVALMLVAYTAFIIWYFK